MILSSKRGEVYTARVGTKFTFVIKTGYKKYEKLVDLEGCDCMNYFDYGIGFIKLKERSNRWYKIYQEKGVWKYSETEEEDIKYYKNFSEARLRQPEQLQKPIII